MRTVRTLSSITLLLIAAAPTLAATNTTTATAKSSVAYYNTIDRTLKPVTLTGDEMAKLGALKKDYQQKFTDAYAKADVLTPEQKKARVDARAAAKAAGKKGKDITKAVGDAVKETDDQKAKARDALPALRGLQAEFKAKVINLLTEQQRQAIRDAANAKRTSKAAASASKKAA